jgi:hypothetical protein
MLVRPAPPSTGRARGGKFRATKTRALAQIAVHGLDPFLAALREAHVDFPAVDGQDADEAAALVANHFFPLGPA